MKVKELTLKVVCFDELSEAIKEELGFLEVTKGDTVQVNYANCFLVNVPKTVEDLEEQPLWADLCKQEDFKASEPILVLIPFNKKIKRRNGKKHEQKR